MDYFKGLSTSGIFGDKSSKIKTWSLSKVEYAYDEKYCLHKFYFKYGNIYNIVDNEAVLKIKA